MFKLNKVLMVLTVIVMLTSAFVGSMAQAQDDELVELVFIYPSNSSDPDAVSAVQDALNAILEERINAHVELRPMDFATFRERMPLINASGEDYDIVFTAPWINNFYQNVADGNLLALDDYLAEVPALAAEFNENLWAVTTVNGSIHGIPGRQWFPKTFGFAVTIEYADRYGLDAETVQSITSFDELTPYMVAMKEGEGAGFYPLGGVHILPSELLGYDPIVGQANANELVGVAFSDDPTNPVAVNLIASEEFRSFMYLRHEWQNLELTPFDPITRDEANDGLSNSLYAFEFAQQERPNIPSVQKSRLGIDIYVQSIAPAVLTTPAMNATMLAVNASSDHPVRALQFLELLQTDVEVYNLLAKGIEGVNWNFVDAELGVIEFTEDNSYTPNVDWMFGNTYLAYVTDAEQLEWTAQSIEMNATAQPSPILGFALDVTPIEMEIAALNAIAVEYAGILNNGLSDDVDGTIEEYLSALDAAGMQTVLDEVNSQIQAWLETK